MPDTCPANWFYHDRHCYLLSQITRSWYGHVSECLYFGSHLVSIRSRSEQVTITNNLNRRFGGSSVNLFIGLKYSNGVPSWEGGRSVQYFNWEINQPIRGYRGGDCAFLRHTNGINRDLWAIGDCTYHTTPYSICKAPSGEYYVSAVFGTSKVLRVLHDNTLRAHFGKNVYFSSPTIHNSE